MADLKREYVVPLRRRVKLAPRWRRSKKAVAETKAFLQKHMKTHKVVMCSELNEELWANGGKNPPGKVSVVAVKTTVNGIPMTIANLSSVGVDEQLKLYEAQQQEAAAEQQAADQVQDAEVSEKETSAEETKEESKSQETSAKEASKESGTSSEKKEASSEGTEESDKTSKKEENQK